MFSPLVWLSGLVLTHEQGGLIYIPGQGTILGYGLDSQKGVVSINMADVERGFEFQSDWRLPVRLSQEALCG